MPVAIRCHCSTPFCSHPPTPTPTHTLSSLSPGNGWCCVARRYLTRNARGKTSASVAIHQSVASSAPQPSTDYCVSRTGICHKPLFRGAGIALEASIYAPPAQILDEPKSVSPAGHDRHPQPLRVFADRAAMARAYLGSGADG